MFRNVLKVVATLLSLSLATVAVAEEMFKWTDDKGVLHYTQTPPEGREFEIIQVAENDSRGSASSASRTRPPEAEEPASRIPKTDVERYIATRNNNCELAKRNLNTLTNVARIRVSDGVGGERLLTDKEKSEKVALTKEQVKSFCSKENDLTRQKTEVTESDS